MTYSYDALARLQYATAGPTGTPTWKLGFVYDRYGNRTQQNLLAGTGFATQTPTDPVTNRLMSPNVYDASGNVTNDTLHTYTVACPERSRRDAENRIQTVDSTAATYTYDGGPLRVKEVVTGATVARIYSGSKLIAYYVNGALAGEYVYAGNTLVAGLDSNGTRIYHHPDHLTQRVLTNPSGGVEWTGGHYPFGESWYQPTGNDSWRFTTYLRYSESGLDYAIFRDDSTRLGRFMSPDPLGGTIRNPQSLNRYAYVLNDPVDLTDPLGLVIFVCRGGGREGGPSAGCPGGGGGPGDHPPLQDTGQFDKAREKADALLKGTKCQDWIKQVAQAALLLALGRQDASGFSEGERDFYEGLGPSFLGDKLDAATIVNHKEMDPTETIVHGDTRTIIRKVAEVMNGSTIWAYNAFFDLGTKGQGQVLVHEGFHLMFIVSDDDLARAAGVYRKDEDSASNFQQAVNGHCSKEPK